MDSVAQERLYRPKRCEDRFAIVFGLLCNAYSGDFFAIDVDLVRLVVTGEVRS